MKRAITHKALARFLDLPVLPLCSGSHQRNQNEIQSLNTYNNKSRKKTIYLVWCFKKEPHTI